MYMVNSISVLQERRMRLGLNDVTRMSEGKTW
jgi:hypothetical protein